MCVHIQTSMHTYISLQCQLRRPRSNNTPSGNKHTQYPDFCVLILFSHRRNQDCLKKWLIIPLLRKYKMFLEKLLISQCKELLKHTCANAHTCTHNNHNITKAQKPVERANYGQSQSNLSKTVLNYNSIYKVSIHESILIQMNG